MTIQDDKTLDGFPKKSVAEITDIAWAKIERMLLQKYGKSIVEFRVYQSREFPYLVAAKLKDGTYKTLAVLQCVVVMNQEDSIAVMQDILLLRCHLLLL